MEESTFETQTIIRVRSLGQARQDRSYIPTTDVYAFDLGLHSSPHARTHTPFPPSTPPLPEPAPSSSCENATASCVPSALNSSAEIGAGYLGNWRRRFFAAGSQSETVESPPPVAKVPQLHNGRGQYLSYGTEVEIRLTLG